MTTQHQNKPKITHEADAQRQHVRVPLPAAIVVDNKKYELKDWSVVGACITVKSEAETNRFKEHAAYKAVLIFTMDEFDLHIPMDIQVQHPDFAKQQVGIQYVNMTQRQVSLMQELVNSYVNGSITTANDLIHVVGRNNFTKPRELPKKGEVTAGEKAGLLFRKGLLIVGSVLLFSYLLFSIYERNFIVTAENAYVDANGFSVEVPSGGLLYFNNLNRGDRVNKGDVIMTVQSESGAIKGFDSPCDCIVNQKLVRGGSKVNTGDKVLRLVPLESEVFVDAFLNYKSAVDIKEGQTVDISVNGSDDHYDGIVQDVSSTSLGKGKYEVRIRPTKPIPDSLLGTPVDVRVDTFGLIN